MHNSDSVLFIALALVVGALMLCVTWYNISKLDADARVALAAVAAGLEQRSVGKDGYQDVIWIKPMPVEAQK